MSNDKNTSDSGPAKTPDEIHAEALAGIDVLWKSKQINFGVARNLIARADYTLRMNKQAAKAKIRHDWEESVEKYAHVWKQEQGGFLCPIHNEIVQQCYTDHSRGGYDEGEFRIIHTNACRLCGDPDFSVGRKLKELNEKRKKEDA